MHCCGCISLVMYGGSLSDACGCLTDTVSTMFRLGAFVVAASFSAAVGP